MIRNNLIFFYIILYFFIILSRIGNSYEISIANKYNEIFTNDILNVDDIENYRKIYLLQENCKWKSANKYIFKIQNKILLGHIFAQRYLHPTCYRSKYLELYYWLKKYNDHPQAKRIYRLAVKRMPMGYKSPNKPIKPIGIQEEKIIIAEKQKYKSQKKLSKKQKQE